MSPAARDRAEIQEWIRSHLYDEVPVAISVIDREYRVLDANRQFEEEFGSWRGKRCYSAYKGRDAPCPRCAAVDTFRDGRPRTREEHGIGRQGEQIDYLVHLVPEFRDGGEVHFVVEMSTDITAFKRLEQEKRQAERMCAVGETVAGVAHGIKNILMGLEGGLYAVSTGLERGDDARIAQGWTAIQDNVHRISEFMKEFLDFAKGRPNVARLVDPNEPARQVADLYREEAARAGIRLDLRLQPGLRPAALDPEGIHTCLANLVSNAIDACMLSDRKRPFEITLATLEEEDTLIYEVWDNGQGMDSDTTRHIFSKFFTTKGSDRGTGLGLLTTRRIVDQHGGRIWFTTSEGAGSVFRIELPRHALPEPAPGDDPAVAPESPLTPVR